MSTYEERSLTWERYREALADHDYEASGILFQIVGAAGHLDTMREHGDEPSAELLRHTLDRYIGLAREWAERRPHLAKADD